MSWLFGKKKTPQGKFMRCFSCAVAVPCSTCIQASVLASQNFCVRTSECWTKPLGSLTVNAWPCKIRKRKSLLRSRRQQSRVKWYCMSKCYRSVLSLHALRTCSHPLVMPAGCCQGHGQITCQKQACSDKDVWVEVTATSSVPADTGQNANTLLCAPDFLLTFTQSVAQVNLFAHRR